MKIKRFQELNEDTKHTKSKEDVYPLLRILRGQQAYDDKNVLDSVEVENMIEEFILKLCEFDAKLGAKIIYELMVDGKINYEYLEPHVDTVEKSYDYQKWVVEKEPKSIGRIITKLNKELDKEQPHLKGGKRSGIL